MGLMIYNGQNVNQNIKVNTQGKIDSETVLATQISIFYIKSNYDEMIMDSTTP